MADLAIYLLGLAEMTGVDLQDHIEAKMPKNATRVYQRLPNGASGVRRDVADHGVRVAALGVQIGIRVVLRDAPQAILFVPVNGPPQMVLQEAGDPRGVRGRG